MFKMSHPLQCSCGRYFSTVHLFYLHFKNEYHYGLKFIPDDQYLDPAYSKPSPLSKKNWNCGSKLSQFEAKVAIQLRQQRAREFNDSLRHKILNVDSKKLLDIQKKIQEFKSYQTGTPAKPVRRQSKKTEILFTSRQEEENSRKKINAKRHLTKEVDANVSDEPSAMGQTSKSIDGPQLPNKEPPEATKGSAHVPKSSTRTPAQPQSKKLKLSDSNPATKSQLTAVVKPIEKQVDKTGPDLMSPTTSNSVDGKDVQLPKFKIVNGNRGPSKKTDEKMESKAKRGRPIKVESKIGQQGFDQPESQGRKQNKIDSELAKSQKDAQPETNNTRSGLKAKEDMAEKSNSRKPAAKCRKPNKVVESEQVERKVGRPLAIRTRNRMMAIEAQPEKINSDGKKVVRSCQRSDLAKTKMTNAENEKINRAKVGRPKKIPNVEDETDEPKKMKRAKVGRPRKMTKVEDETDEPKKMKRAKVGRPRKMTNDAAKKGKVGRPKKVNTF